MLQQFAMEELVRSDGGSGIKQVRGSVHTIDRGYYAPSHVGGGRRGSMASIHDHSNYRTTLGMGDAIVSCVLFVCYLCDILIKTDTITRCGGPRLNILFLWKYELSEFHF